MSQPNQEKNKKSAITVVMFVIGMFALAYASFPIYNLLCKVTGLGGTPKISKVEGSEIGERLVTVRFNGDVMNDMPWKFMSLQDKVVVRTGENKLIFFTAENNSDVPITGVATYNVTPLKAANYFNKVQCFCFERQTLQPHQKVEMPVSFFIDPDIEKDPEMKGVKTITLSYTFFKAKD
ncbi:MAG: cytochrome c oxidase assembly protein [Rickettsiaceae bacterium]|jgi:cytochrome c oxidase assembly protein subunit 11|nr:cytochrome c oxidase assembly protein [Rickettsiaceae bacterium]